MSNSTAAPAVELLQVLPELQRLGQQRQWRVVNLFVWSNRLHRSTAKSLSVSLLAGSDPAWMMFTVQAIAVTRLADPAG